MPTNYSLDLRIRVIQAYINKEQPDITLKELCRAYQKWSTDGEILASFIEQHLVSALTKRSVVILDGVSLHKMKRVKELIESTGAKLIYLPPYSPVWLLYYCQ